VKKRFAPTSFFIAAGEYSWLLREFFSMANASRFLSWKQMKITSYGNYSEQMSIA